MTYSIAVNLTLHVWPYIQNILQKKWPEEKGSPLKFNPKGLWCVGMDGWIQVLVNVSGICSFFPWHIQGLFKILRDDNDLILDQMFAKVVGSTWLHQENINYVNCLEGSIHGNCFVYAKG